jgi:hypothetical protein
MMWPADERRVSSTTGFLRSSAAFTVDQDTPARQNTKQMHEIESGDEIKKRESRKQEKLKIK